jgi:hypothetical protein
MTKEEATAAAGFSEQAHLAALGLGSSKAAYHQGMKAGFEAHAAKSK